MIALEVIVYIAVGWMIGSVYRQQRRANRRERERSSWLGQHQRNIAAARHQREADESAQIGWRRG